MTQKETAPRSVRVELADNNRLEDAFACLGVHDSTGFALLRRGELHGFNVWGRRMISREELLAYRDKMIETARKRAEEIKAAREAGKPFPAPRGRGRPRKSKGAVDDETSRANFERFRDQAAQGTLRIQRYSFLDTDHVEVVYAIYYGPNRSPIVTAPQRGTAVRSGGRWKLARTTLCGLASLVQLACDAGSDAPAPPPDGWADPATEPALVDAFRTMADTRASLEERVETVVGGEDLRDVVRAGLDADQRYAGKVSFHVSGVRRTGGGAQVLYAVLASGDPVLETPYPLIGAAVFDHGRWRVGAEYACGLVGLVSQWCPPAGEPTTTTSSVVEGEATTTTTTTEVLQEGEQEDLGGVGDEPGVTGEVPEGHVG